MNSIDEAPVYPVYSVVGDRYVFLLTSAQTDGAFAVLESFVPPGGGTPPHVHHREDEAFYIISGDFEFVIDGAPTYLSAGDFVFARRDIPHHFKNVGKTPGRMILTLTPGGLEAFFAEVGTRLGSRDDAPIPPTSDDIARLIEATPRYGLEILIPHESA